MPGQDQGEWRSGRKEQRSKITDLIKSFNAITSEKEEGGKEQHGEGVDK